MVNNRAGVHSSPCQALPTPRHFPASKCCCVWHPFQGGNPLLVKLPSLSVCPLSQNKQTGKKMCWKSQSKAWQSDNKSPVFAHTLSASCRLIKLNSSQVFLGMTIARALSSLGLVNIFFRALYISYTSNTELKQMKDSRKGLELWQECSQC